MRRIRILHIIEQLGVGGAERQLLGLLPRMDRARFEHRICYFRQKADSLDWRFRELGIPTTFVDKDGLSLPRFFNELRRAIRTAGPDIVHTWLYVANFWGRWAAVSAGVHRLIASDRAEIEQGGALLRVHERLLASRTLRLANSRAVAMTLHRCCGLPLDEIRVIYNAVDLPPCDPRQAREEIRRELGLPAEHRLVIMVARQAREKNYPMFFRVAGRVTAGRPGVTFVALGRLDLKEEMDKVLAELKIGDRIRVIGSRSDVHRWLAAADVFCLTSDREGFPNVVIEAMTAGLPVVCTDFGSAREVIGEEGAGVLVPRNDDTAMARAVERLLDDPEERTTLGQRARQRAEGCFGWPRLVAEMENLYLERMGSR